MDRTSFALLLLVACTILSTAASQGRSRVDLVKVQPEDIAAIAGQLTGPNAGKLLLPGRGPSRAASEFAKDSFIVQTEGAHPAEVEAIMESVRGRAVKVTDLNGPVFQGFALQVPPGLAQQSALLQELIDSAAVTLVEADMIVTAVQTVQNGATWGLDRIDQRDLPLSSTYSYTGTASDVTAYIIDTGILTTHTQFGGRARWGANFASDGRNTDCNGHGTHCAGTVGGATYGVAKGVRLVAVKVLNCQGSGTLTGVISGMNWAVTNCASTPSKKCVASMSLGGGASSTVDSAVAGATNAGVVMVVAAGNNNQPACSYSPARAPSAITVGATTRTDTRSSFSNFGTCVDIFAPGSEITSAFIGSTTATAIASGTSMAAPHVSGVVALELSKLAAAPANAAAVSSLVNTVITKATPNKVIARGTGSPNLLLFSA